MFPPEPDAVDDPVAALRKELDPECRRVHSIMEAWNDWRKDEWDEQAARAATRRTARRYRQDPARYGERMPRAPFTTRSSDKLAPEMRAMPTTHMEYTIAREDWKREMNEADDDARFCRVMRKHDYLAAQRMLRMAAPQPGTATAPCLRCKVKGLRCSTFRALSERVWQTTRCGSCVRNSCRHCVLWAQDRENIGDRPEVSIAYVADGMLGRGCRSPLWVYVRESGVESDELIDAVLKILSGDGPFFEAFGVSLDRKCSPLALPNWKADHKHGEEIGDSGSPNIWVVPEEPREKTWQDYFAEFRWREEYGR